MTTPETSLQPLKPAPINQANTPKPPTVYHLRWHVQTPKGYALEIARDTTSAELVALVRQLDETFEKAGLTPAPVAPAALAAVAASGGNLVMVKNDDDTWSCPAHGVGKYVPPGTNQQGKPYKGFWACKERDCKAKPPRGN